MMTENKKIRNSKSEKLNGILSAVVIMSKNTYGFLSFSLLPDCFYGTVCMLFSAQVLIHGKRTRN